MQKWLILFGMILWISTAVWASPPAQFAGCADEIGKEFGARYTFTAKRGETLTIVAIGEEAFDPELSLMTPSENPLVCNDDGLDGANYGANLPFAPIQGGSRTAILEYTVPDATPQQDFLLVVTSANQRSGNFMLLINGMQLNPSDEVDEYGIPYNEGQVRAEVPLGIYAMNINRPDQVLDPVLEFRYLDIFEEICYKSSSAALCEGAQEDMSGYSVTWAGESALLNGDDVMVYYTLGGQSGEFDLNIKSYQGNSFGPYLLAIYSGVGYPPDLAQ